MPPLAAVPALICLLSTFAWPTLGAAQCVDYSDDPAGCQPSTFDTPIAAMPSGRVDRRGKLDASSSEEDARAGVRAARARLAPVPQFRAPALGDHRAVASAMPPPAHGAAAISPAPATRAASASQATASSSVMETAPGVARNIDVFRIQPIPSARAAGQSRRDPGAPARQRRIRRSRAPRTRVHRLERRGSDAARDGTPARTRSAAWRRSRSTATRVCAAKSEVHDFHAPSHEFYLWHDPANSNRLLALRRDVRRRRLAGSRRARTSGPGRDRARDHGRTHRCPARQTTRARGLQPAGRRRPADQRAARRDGAIRRRTVRGFQPSARTERIGPRNLQNRQNNMLHSLSVSDDGERVYVAGGNAGFYIAEFCRDREQL